MRSKAVKQKQKPCESISDTIGPMGVKNQQIGHVNFKRKKVNI